MSSASGRAPLTVRAAAYVRSAGLGHELVAELLHALNNQRQIIDGWRQLNYIPSDDPSPVRLPGGHI